MSDKVDTRKRRGSSTADLDRMSLETDELLATSANLVSQVEELMEECRQLLAAQAALLEQRKKNKRK
jgi:predicted nuclease with TOPRIM domain